eukprot:EG_transcript_4145
MPRGILLQPPTAGVGHSWGAWDRLPAPAGPAALRTAGWLLPAALLAVAAGLGLGLPRRRTALSALAPDKVPPGQQFSAIAVDLDGTLLNEDHKVSEATRATLQALSRRGLRVILATGRSLPACHEHVRALALDVPLPVVCYNGACGVVYHPGREEPEVLFEVPVPRPQREALLQLAEELGVLAQYYHGDHIYVRCRSEQHHNLIHRYRTLSGVGHTQVASYEEVLALPPCKVLLMTDDPDAVVAAGRRRFADGSLTVVRGTPPFFVEFLHPAVCKGVGFARMCEALGQPLQEVVAFGDGDNDVEMLQMAGRGFAMRNARHEVRSQMEHVTEFPNTEDGVVKELLKLQQNGLLRSADAAAIAMLAIEGEKDGRDSGNQALTVPPRFVDSPFTVGKVVTTMLLWGTALAFVGLFALPLTCALCGIDLLQLSAVQKAEYLATLQTLETLAALAVFSWALEPYHPLPDGWFQYGRSGPLGRRGWLTWALLGILLAPLALIGGSLVNDAIGQTGSSATVQAVAKLVETSGPSSQVVLLLMSGITAVLAPLMEEGVFRGFLLTALTKWMPVPAAMVVSSAAFAAAHFSAHDFVPLFLLGNLLALAYVQTKDLLAPTLVHCLWNLLVLMVVAGSLGL